MKKALAILSAMILAVPVEATVYYLSPSGNNANPGTSGSRWQTFAYAVAHTTPSDTVIAGPGRYAEWPNITAGSASVWQAEFNAVENATTNTSVGGFGINSANGKTIRGFEMRDPFGPSGGIPKFVYLQGNTTNTLVELNWMTENGATANGFEPVGIFANALTVDGVTVRSNIISWYQGIGISLCAQNVWVEGNNVYRGRNCVTKGDTNSTVVVNDVDCSRFFGINHTVTNNIFHDLFYTDQHPLAEGSGNAHCDAIMIFSSGVDVLCSNILVVANILMNVDDQAFITSDLGANSTTTNLIKNITFKNNIILNCGGGGLGGPGYFFNCYDTAFLTIEYNLFARYGTDSRGTSYNSHPIRLQTQGGGRGGCTNAVIKGNTFYGFDGGAGETIIIDATSAVNTTMDYNLRFPTFPDTSGFSETHTVKGSDPLFVSPGTDWRLQSASPARDAGVTLSDVTDDRNQVARPQGIAFDIGPYEFTGSSAVFQGRMTTRKGAARR